MKGSCEIVRQFDPNLPALRLDAGKITQVFVNLFTNALHAMDARGTVTVRTFVENHGGTVVVEIDDTGPGIPEEKLTQVFEPFFTTKPSGKGTGLGLSVVKSILDMHGAVITLHNRPEGGLKARVAFPLPAADQPGFPHSTQ
jgi:signal transduction histidine kinase